MATRTWVMRVGAAVGVALACAAPVNADGDATAPSSSFSTPPNSIVVTHGRSDAQYPGGFSAYSVKGVTVDTESGFSHLLVTWESGDERVVRVHETSMSDGSAVCDTGRHTCSWQLTPPATYPLAVAIYEPGVWTVTVRAVDMAGNVEAAGPSLQVVVI